MWCVRLSDSQREAVRGLISAAVERDPGLAPLLEAVELARWDDLPDASLPWDRVSELARRQNIGEADVVWDLASGMHARPRLQLPVRAQLPPPDMA
jgi:hypothetical protein